MRPFAFAFFSVLFFGLNGCKNSLSDKQPVQFVNKSYMDSLVSPGDDFFTFINGRWMDTATIPETEFIVGSFSDLINSTKFRLKGVLDDVSQRKTEKGSAEQLAGDFYLSGMDSATIEKLGYEPVKPELQKVSHLNSPADIMKFVAEQHSKNRMILFQHYVAADEKNSGWNILTLYQGGLGLPDRSYYFNSDTATQKIVNAYQVFVQKLFALTGDDSAAARANAALVFNFETQLAGAHKTLVELRDPQTNYHKMAVDAADKKMPAFSVGTVLSEWGVKVDSINISQPAYFQKIDQLLVNAPMQTWKQYLRFHLLDATAKMLSSDFVDADFAFTKALTGQAKLKPRWERMVSVTDSKLGDALGQLYVKKYFPPDAKKRMEDLVANLETALGNRINNLRWMSDSTKSKATDKLHAITNKIGYPDKWRDQSKLQISKSDFYGNVVAADVDQFNFDMAQLGKPVDKSLWAMSAPTINAYYNPVNNEIVFPAGILQFPFFDMDADDAINYGGIGMVIGHEMTHGFDDQGAQYDKDGNMRNWWTKKDYEQFRNYSQKMIDEYDGFTVLDGLHVNGKQTTGENIADFGGMAIAYDAFKMTAQGKDTTRIDGLTPDERFFVSFGQIWRSKIKPEMARLWLNVDFHSPELWRVNGPLRNFDPFYKTFNLQPGQKMYKPDSSRIVIW